MVETKEAEAEIDKCHPHTKEKTATKTGSHKDIKLNPRENAD